MNSELFHHRSVFEFPCWFVLPAWFLPAKATVLQFNPRGQRSPTFFTAA